MFGLMSSEQLEGSFSLNSRRRVFYQYPNGAAPLLGLLSLMETEETDKAEFGWYEDRLDDQRTETASISSGNGPFSDSGSDTPKTAAGFNIAENDVLRVLVDSTAKFRPRNVIMVRNCYANGVLVDLKGVIVAIISATKFEMRMLKAFTSVQNSDTGATTTAIDKDVIVIGSANPEGARSGTGIFLPPKNPLNFTQIFRTAFSFTRTALKAGLAWDKTGIYKAKAKQNCIRHMMEIEKSFLFGQKQEYAVIDQGDETVERTTGGLWYWLEKWEEGTLYGVDPATSDDHPNKRIFKVNGTLTRAEFKSRMARIFKVTNNTDYAKLCLCGNGFFDTVNDAFEKSLQFQTGQVAKGSYGMNITKWETTNGTVYFKTHPLFNQLETFNNTAMFIDVPMLNYRPLNDSDTVLLKNRQENDQDRRKDEWLTEAGLEVRHPESCGIIDGLTGITP